jgi:hypothetical protein
MMMNKLLLTGLLAMAALQGEAKDDGLNKNQFDKCWRVESESPDYKVSFIGGDTCELVAPKGLTLWRKEKMTGNTTIEYDACVMDEGRQGDRLSDLNCFWMAQDPKAKDIWARMAWRSGVFTRCYSLQMYYMGYGGNSNTTTRFRRYSGDEAGVTDAAKRPAILREYTDGAHLLLPNHWYHIRLRCIGGRVQYFIDGQLLVDYTDPQPLTSGWFGFRTTQSRTRITNFRYEKSASIDVPLHWVGTTPMADRPVSFGVPFAKGELKDVSALTLGDGIAADKWVNARWPDGSVKWAGMAAVVPANSHGLRITTQSKGMAASAKADKLQIVDNGSQIVISTGKIKAYIPKSGKAILDSLYLGTTKTGDAVRLVASTQNRASGGEGDIRFTSFEGQISRASVERAGNVRAVVKLEGSLSGAGREWLPFVLRMYFYAHSEQIKMVYSFVFDGDQDKDFIHSLGLRFSVPMREDVYNRHIAFSCGNGGVWSEPVQPLDGRRELRHDAPTDGVMGGKISPKERRQEAKENLQAEQMASKRIPDFKTFDEQGRFLLSNWAQWDGYRLSQLSDEGFTIRKRATADSPWIGTYSGHRADGYAFVGDVSGGLGVQLADFWQSYPSTIEIENARTPMADMTIWLWSPEAEAMDLRHYDKVAHNLLASYEDVQEGMSTPYGVARTSTLYLVPQPSYPGKEGIARTTEIFDADAQLMPLPEYLHEKHAFGIWSLPDSSSADRAKVEKRLSQYISFYQKAIAQNHWYGFWNYGDIMHAYDAERHEWRYDVGGFAWDNTELATPDWLWYSFLRSGRADILRMAEAMTRHNSEVDTYHIGDMAGLGSRHNVSHWGCGAKEARISQAAFNRFYYYLTTDERMGDLMTAVRDADQKLYKIDPMRLAEPRSKYPCTAPARLRIGPDWLAYAGNWMTEWERTGNTKYRDKILTGMKSIGALRHGIFTGNLALGYDPATGAISFEGDTAKQSTNHLVTIMGGFEMMNELMEMVDVPSFNRAWLDFAIHYKQKAWEISTNRFPVRRLMAYAANKTGNIQLAAEAWNDLWSRVEHEARGAFSLHDVTPPDVPETIAEWDGISSNDAALWSLDAIYMLEVIGK